MGTIKIRPNADTSEWIEVPVLTSNTDVSWDSITNKPNEFTPDQHASEHAAGGSDPITPASIGITPSITELSYLEGTTSNVQTQLNAKAPLASPTLTGTPKAPTAAVGTSTTQIATTAFVVAEVTAELDALVGTAPETLNTIHEIATALIDNADAIDVLETTAANKFDKTGGVVSGPITLPADPTEALHAATKRYVDNAAPSTPADIGAQPILTAGQNITITGNVITAIGGLYPKITVTIDSGSNVSATDGTTTVTGVSNGTCTLVIPNYGTWTVTATLGMDSKSTSVVVNAVKEYALILAYPKIYGAQWDGTSTTTWSRTDDAADFIDPVPYVSGATNYSSPFDSCMPWSGMERITDAEAGELVAIPKYWYKWTKTGATMKLQIADTALTGFIVSPAHADRGDGVGERDVVYVGRYHCGSSNYKSVSGQTPKVSIRRSVARSSIHALGSTVWQYDFAMYWTIMMLYLVEFADWNSQAKIGYGCGNGGSVEAVGASDSMPYHTGTMQASRTTYGVGCQYRYIEGLWDNVYDWCDGIYFSGANIYCIKNPASFSDTANGTNIGTRPTSNGYISAWSIPSASGFGYALYPSAVAGSESTYICDHGSSTGVVLCCGGYYKQYQSRGLFCLYGDNSASDTSAYFGCRLMKLPPNQ